MADVATSSSSPSVPARDPQLHVRPTQNSTAAAAAGAVNTNGSTNNHNPIHDSRFDCNICLESVSEPVVTQCGHMYCWPCLYRWLEPGLTAEERFDMGWTTAEAGGGAGAIIHNLNATVSPSSINNGRGRRCCPVCKTECTVMTVIPIYVRESSHEPQQPPPPTMQNGENRSAADSNGNAATTETTNDDVVDNSNIDDDRISSGYDVISSTGLRRRRSGRGEDGEGIGDDVSNIGSSLSLSTISTHDNADNGIDRNLPNPNHHPISPPVHQQSFSASHIPSRPTRQSFLHQRSSSSAADPMTPLINNYSRQQTSRGTDGVARIPPSPPRAARPSSLSNGLSLSFWSSIVDGILGNPNDGGRGGSNGRHIPPIHRRPGDPGVVSNRNAGQGPTTSGEANAGGGSASSEENNPSRTGSPPISTSNFLPVTVEDSTTEFLSRLLLLLGSFVIFCLLLF